MARIFILDDEQQTAVMLGRFVDLMGYDYQVYTQASTFFEENEGPFESSILMLDLNMPEMDGIEVMRKMAKTGCTMPLILVSGYDSGVLHSAEQLAVAHSIEILATFTKPLQYKA